MKKSVLATDVSTRDASALEGRKKLRAWMDKSKHKNISFWVPPHVSGNTDAIISDVANALSRFEEEKAAGKIKFSRNIKFSK
jgi:hypothetical protein